jgi:hypothetical protein
VALRLQDLSGGTEAQGVPRSVFAMPPGSVIRYDRPDADIADFVTGYHLYAAGGPHARGKIDWFLPGTANVRVTLQPGGPVSVRIGRREHPDVPPVALYGPTSRALRAVTNGGVMIGFGLSALGWARMFGRSAEDVRDRIAPLVELVGPELPDRLLAALSRVPDEHEVKHALDALLAPLVARPHPDEPAIRALMTVLTDPTMIDVAQAVERVGLPAPALRRLAQRHFGFAPKLLLRRARFLRSFTGLFRAEDDPGYTRIDPSYHDVSHFLRDADRFLGMTPRRFAALSTPFLDASVRARAAVLGSPTQALHDVATALAGRQGSEER